jgi:uncharacterized membrane-anchored protein
MHGPVLSLSTDWQSRGAEGFQQGTAMTIYEGFILLLYALAVSAGIVVFLFAAMLILWVIVEIVERLL